MKIVRISATTHRVGVPVPLLDDPVVRQLVFVRVETDDGIVGYGMTGPIQRHGVREMINQEITPLLIGEDPLATEMHIHRLLLALNPRYQTGAWSSAVSAVDIALWDIKGKFLKEPVWRLLGGAQQTVPAYTTFGLPDYDPDQLVEVATDLASKGHDKLKMVVGVIDDHESPRKDAERVRRVREAIGDDIELMIDANYMFSFSRALELCKLIEPYGITWFEEPLYGNDPRLLAQLRQRTSIPISAGQNEGSKWRHRELLVNESVDILQPNVVYVGGYTEGLKVAGMAQAWNLKIANGGGWPHHNMHLQAAVYNGWRVEFHLDMWLIGEAIFYDPPAPSNGRVALTDRPGLGLEPREDTLKETLETLETL